jgi:hypothetical protein
MVSQSGKNVRSAIRQLCRCCDNAIISGPRLSTGIAVLNRFNSAPTIHLPLVVLKLAIIVLAVTNYSKTFKNNGIDTENGKEKKNSKE